MSFILLITLPVWQWYGHHNTLTIVCWSGWNTTEVLNGACLGIFSLLILCSMYLLRLLTQPGFRTWDCWLYQSILRYSINRKRPQMFIVSTEKGHRCLNSCLYPVFSHFCTTDVFKAGVWGASTAVAVSNVDGTGSQYQPPSQSDVWHRRAACAQNPLLAWQPKLKRG